MTRTGEERMAIQEFHSEEEMEEAFERLEELQFEHLALKEAVEEKRGELKEAEDDLRCFEEDNKESLLAP